MSFLRLGDPALSVPAAVEALRAWLAAESAQPLLIETSGSTGAPKRVVLSRAAVLASAEAALDRLGGPGAWALALPPSYVAGVQVIVRSLLAGHDPVALDDVAGSAGEPQGRLYTSLVATQLHRLLETDPETLRRFDTILLGGGPVDAGLRRRAEAAGAHVVATYGSSETAGGCVYDGVPLAGVEIRIGEDARIAIRGPMLFEEYDGDPALTAQTLVDGWFLTTDLGSFEEGRLRVLGRIDDVVISGGVNVPTPAVAARLRQHPAVSDAAVIGVPDAEWGQRIVAYVVGPLSLEAARDWVGAVHPRAWAPREVRHLAALPKLSNGKLDRRALS